MLSARMPIDYHVEITSSGRSGGVTYREDEAGEYSTWWELAGGNRALAFIAIPTPEQWDLCCPWAAGRRREVLERIALEVIRQQASGYFFEVEDGFINIVRGVR